MTLQFHDLRNQSPDLCSTRLGNKIWYALNGVRAIFDDLPFIDEHVQVRVRAFIRSLDRGRVVLATGARAHTLQCSQCRRLMASCCNCRRKSRHSSC